jgi:glycosyltransferase involved in cell wall biosynthesis
MNALKRWFFSLLGKDPEAVVAHFVAGPAERGAAMAAEIRALEPEREHIVIEGGADEGFWMLYRRARRLLRRKRIGLAPVLIHGAPHPLRWVALALAPRKLLAFNERGERHHLRLSTPIASWLFWRGVPLDRIFLRPWKSADTRKATQYRVLEGRPLIAGRRRVAIVSPYFPWPLSHGGAVRIYHLLREAARDFDIDIFAFAEAGSEAQAQPVLDLVHRAVLFEMPRYRHPRWASLLPPEVREFDSPVLRELLAHESFDLTQVEYTHLADYGGEVLAEHDVTFDLYRQIHARERRLSTWWDLWRWERYERRMIAEFRAVAVMSAKDAELLGESNAVVLPNGVDLERFTPEPEAEGQRLLFVGSFRHFPNVQAFAFFYDEVWPVVKRRFPNAQLTVVAGPQPELYWHRPLPDVDFHAFVSDVRPLYAAANVVVVPTLVSAGTNLKVLEAMAMERAVVSTPSGCEGLGLRHRQSIWIAEGASEFAEATIRLLEDRNLRQQLAKAARAEAERRFDWRQIGREQKTMWEGLL